MKRIFLSPPHMSGQELELIQKVFESNYIAPLGEYVNRFEDSIHKFTGAKHVLAVNTGTSAIHLALRVLNIGIGDYVLASSFTFIGSIAPILYMGAIPIFIDSDESWNLSPKLLRDFLSNWKEKKPKALILTHLYGQMADIEEIYNICRKNDIFIIEDSAEALGAEFNNQASGTFGDFGIYSFNGNKILTTSSGGILIGKNEELMAKARFLSTQAKEDTIHYEHIEFGYNYRMSNVLASIGVAQMEVLNQRIEKRRQIFNIYKNLLEDSVEFMPEIYNSRGNRWLTTILFKNSDLNLGSIIHKFNRNGIEVRHLWKPMHLQPLFKDSINYTNGVSEDMFKRGLCLPSGTAMEIEDIERVVKIIKEFI
jgi:UDP-N-acetylbacillosamine transaminase